MVPFALEGVSTFFISFSYRARNLNLLRLATLAPAAPRSTPRSLAMPRSAGNPNMSSKIDASGSSSMGDVHQWFRSGDSTWGQRAQRAADTSAGKLRFAGLGPEVRAMLSRHGYRCSSACGVCIDAPVAGIVNCRSSRPVIREDRSAGCASHRIASHRAHP